MNQAKVSFNQHACTRFPWCYFILETLPRTKNRVRKTSNDNSMSPILSILSPLSRSFNGPYTSSTPSLPSSPLTLSAASTGSIDIESSFANDLDTSYSSVSSPLATLPEKVEDHCLHEVKDTSSSNCNGVTQDNELLAEETLSKQETDAAKALAASMDELLETVEKLMPSVRSMEEFPVTRGDSTQTISNQSSTTINTESACDLHVLDSKASCTASCAFQLVSSAYYLF